jgi:RNA polymerase sigma-70 factor (ECF subfamily)
MSLVAEGDVSAQRTLATRLYGRAGRLTRSLVRSATDAEDAAQSGMLEVLRSAKGYRGESSVERWADRIVVRTTLRLARERRRKQGVLEDDAAVEAAVAPIEEREAAEATPRSADQYLRHLPEPLREVLVLRHVLECSIEEIAETCGVSPNTVKDRLLRARESMRRMIRRDQAIGTRAVLPAEAGRKSPEKTS